MSKRVKIWSAQFRKTHFFQQSVVRAISEIKSRKNKESYKKILKTKSYVILSESQLRIVLGGRFEFDRKCCIILDKRESPKGKKKIKKVKKF